MQNLPHPLLLVTRVALLGLLGFAVIVLAGPVIGIVTAILPFVLVGFLAWCLYQLVSTGPQATWRTLREAGRVAGTASVQTAQFCRQAFATPSRVALRVYDKSKTWAATAWRGATAGARVATEGSLVALSGAGVGGLVGLVTGWQTHEMETSVLLNALIGALLAASVWLAMTILPRKKPPLVEIVTDLPRRTV